MSNPPATAKPTPKLDWIIDCDTHISEPPDLFPARLPAKWHAKAPHVVRNAANGLEMWATGEQGKRSIPIGHTAVAGWKAPLLRASTRSRRPLMIRMRASSTWTRSGSGRWRSIRTSAASAPGPSSNCVSPS